MRLYLGLLISALTFTAHAASPDPDALKAQLQDYYFDAAPVATWKCSIPLSRQAFP